jgi:hypothetical protein
LKVCLVAKGYTQLYGIDYDETFSPIAKNSFVYALISLTANLEWPIFQLDVKNASCMETYMRKFIWSNHLGLLLKGSIKVMSAC